MLLESILGETISSFEPAPNRTSAAYCAQLPWLENDTIQSNIIGVSQSDPKWYKTVKSACGLDLDMQTLERGDKTVVGSKGLNLSGGQKQRIVNNPQEAPLTV
jgi:ABC-type multidrug transport system fused ATPase/permease subunit